jgi:hypothetical protein
MEGMGKDAVAVMVVAVLDIVVVDVVVSVTEMLGKLKVKVSVLAELMNAAVALAEEMSSNARVLGVEIGEHQLMRLRRKMKKQLTTLTSLQKLRSKVVKKMSKILTWRVLLLRLERRSLRIRK